MFKRVAKDRPRWYQFRLGVSNLLIRLARRVYPKNPEVLAFWLIRLRCIPISFTIKMGALEYIKFARSEQVL
jgi:hypothetical protein